MFNNPALEKFKAFIFPIISLVIILVLSATVGKSMVDKVLETRESIAEITNKNQILETKKQTLEKLNEEELSASARSAKTAIPPESPIIQTVVAIRTIAQSVGITVSNVHFSSGANSVSDTKTIDFSFSTHGTFEATLSLLNEIRKMTPLTRVETTKFTINGATVIGNISVHALWEPLPNTFGKVDDPIDPIGDAEKVLLAKLLELKSYTINTTATTVSAIGIAKGRKNPFAF